MEGLNRHDKQIKKIKDYTRETNLRCELGAVVLWKNYSRLGLVCELGTREDYSNGHYC